MSWTRPLRTALFLAAASASLAGCGSARTALRGATPQVANAPNPLEQYAITVAPKSDDLGLTPHAAGLSPAQKQALGDYADRWREAGGDAIEVHSPLPADCRCDARTTALAAQAFLLRLGVPAQAIRLSDDAAAPLGAPVRVSFNRLAAHTADCSKHWSNLVSTYDNGVTSHFGCAVTQNIAAMVADPRDLVHPARTEAADPLRRAAVLDRYRQGQITSSVRDEQAQGTLSSAVGK